ncbi:MAG: aminotransferase class I/II-fold pyridoxal phosphate-dependent enzyme [Oscillospiraceae bacterium]
MADYLQMDKKSLQQELESLQKEYQSFNDMNLKLDMSRGKPSSEQLDISLPMQQVADYKDASGIDARNYGQLDGLPEAKTFFAEMMGVTPEETIVGGNSSLHLMYTCVDLGWRKGFADSNKPICEEEKPKFLCPSPGYDRHFYITQDFGFELVHVPMTLDGPDVDVVEELVQDPSVKGIWCVPVYSNPDGYVYSDETVRRLAAMQTASPDFKIFWDNAYAVHHLTDEAYTCLNILDACKEAGHENRPLLFCSTSKITFSGAGVSAVAASKANISSIMKHLFGQLISFDKMNQLRHVRYLKDQQGMAEHMKLHAEVVRPRFAVVLEGLESNLAPCGDIAHWTNPKGGYFISLYALKGCATRIVDLCKQAGVVLTGAGAAYPYGKDPEDSHIRIAPTFPPINELQTATQLLCVATKIASLEKLLAD